MELMQLAKLEFVMDSGGARQIHAPTRGLAPIDDFPIYLQTQMLSLT
jgi:hypothetical protein